MSWLLGGNKADTPAPENQTDKSPEVLASMDGLNPSALERAAATVAILDKSRNAREAFEISKRQEETLQLQHRATIKKLELELEQIGMKKNAVLEAEKRKTIDLDSGLKKERTEYQDRLARKRQEDQMAFQAKMQEETLRRQEESSARQEAIRRETIAYEAELRLKNETKLLEARLKGEAEMERINKDIRIERTKVEAGEFRETILKSITTAGAVVGAGFEAFLSDKEKIITSIGAITALAAGIYSAKFGLALAAKTIDSRIGKPSLVRDTSRLNVIDAFKHPIKSVSRFFSKPQDPLKGIVLNPSLEANLRKIAVATRHTKSNKGFYRNLLMAGPPGTGKTMFAKSLAMHSGMDYSILTGGDVAPMGSEGVTAIHKVFDWANTSRKGLLVFVDEADAFLRKREQERMSEEMRATLNAFLYRTGEQSDKFMLVLASNQPEQFDWAINDRMDEIVHFDLPGISERERMIRHYFDVFLLQPSANKQQRISLDDSIDYASKCRQIAEKTEGFSGRELSKLVIAWQTAVFSSEKGVLTEEMMDEIVEVAIQANRRKQVWRSHRPPGVSSPDLDHIQTIGPVTYPIREEKVSSV